MAVARYRMICLVLHIIIHFYAKRKYEMPPNKPPAGDVNIAMEDTVSQYGLSV